MNKTKKSEFFKDYEKKTSLRIVVEPNPEDEITPGVGAVGQENSEGEENRENPGENPGEDPQVEDKNKKRRIT